MRNHVAVTIFAPVPPVEEDLLCGLCACRVIADRVERESMGILA